MTTYLFQVKEGSIKHPKTQHKVFKEKLIQDRRKRHQEVPKGTLMSRFSGIEEILKTSEVEIMSDEEPVPHKKKKAAVHNTTTKKTKTSANKVPVLKCPKKTLLLLQRKLVLPQCTVHMAPTPAKY